MGPTQKLLSRLDGAPAATTGSLCLGLVALLGLADYATGPELSSSVFYAVPAAIAAWFAGPAWALVTCVSAAFTWWFADFLQGVRYSHPLIPVWNAAVRLAFFLIIVELLRRLRRALEAQRLLAETDALTGLANSRQFLRAVDAEVARSVRYGRPVALAYVDLDGFKGVNDRWGHHVGDQVLEVVGYVMRVSVRTTDQPSRLGGDEFAVLLTETPAEQARVAVDKLRAELEAAMAERQWPVGFSIGVVTASGEVATGGELVRRADELMYEVKRSGKGRTVFGGAEPAV